MNELEVRSKVQDLRNGRRRATSEIAQVMLPGGEVIWVRVRAAEPVTAVERALGPVDAGLGNRITAPAEILRLPGFSETVRGVLASVRRALDEHRPDSLTVEFGIEIAAKSGVLLSVLAEVGGTAQVRVTASWDRRSAAASSPLSEGTGRNEA